LPDTVTFHTDATLYRCALEPGKNVTRPCGTGRRIYIYLSEGCISINGQTLNSKDQARIDIDSTLEIKAKELSDLILIDVPSCKGWGYNEETLKGQKK